MTRSQATPTIPDRTIAGPSAGPELAGAIDPGWQLRFADSVEAGMTPPEMIQWQSNPLSVAVPSVAVVGTNLFANYLGHIFAVDLASGKMLWRSASFHQIEVPAMQEFARMLDVGRFAIVAAGRVRLEPGARPQRPKYVRSLSVDLPAGR